MNQCKTGCGSAVDGGALCQECGQAWATSPEATRLHAIWRDQGQRLSTRTNVALVDFCDRIRAERNNKPKTEGAR